jgi:glutamine amidotransferase
VRASTVGETNRQNCHPFARDNWSFCHNGQVPHFAQVRRQLEAALPDDLYAARRGTTDSEMIFLTLLAQGLRDDPDAALMRTLSVLGTSAAPVKLTCVFSDGQSLYGFRHATWGEPPTLYLSGTLDAGGRAMASEPLDGLAARWQMIPPDTLVRIDQKDCAARAVA